MITDSTQVLHRRIAAKFIISCIAFKVLPGGQCWNQTSNLPENLQVLAKSPSLPWRLSILKSPFSIEMWCINQIQTYILQQVDSDLLNVLQNTHETIRSVFWECPEFQPCLSLPTSFTGQKDMEQWVTEVFKSPYSEGAFTVTKNTQNCR